jgi:hypothetical protein
MIVKCKYNFVILFQDIMSLDKFSCVIQFQNDFLSITKHNWSDKQKWSDWSVPSFDRNCRYLSGHFDDNNGCS